MQNLIITENRISGHFFVIYHRPNNFKSGARENREASLILPPRLFFSNYYSYLSALTSFYSDKMYVHLFRYFRYFFHCLVIQIYHLKSV